MYKPLAVICDLDGTLADVTAATHFVTEHPRDFNSFHRYAVTDAPVIESTLQRIRHWQALNVPVLFVTGRHERWERPTIEWLQRIDPPIDWDALHMRADDDFRPDHIVKAEIYQRRIAPWHLIIEAIDDRPSIIELWRSLNIPVLVVPGWENH